MIVSGGGGAGLPPLTADNAAIFVVLGVLIVGVVIYFARDFM